MKKKTIIQKFKGVILGILAEIDSSKRGRPNKFDNSFYLDHICMVFFYDHSWNSLTLPTSDESTIRKKFYRWIDLGIFTEAYTRMFNKYSKHRIFKHLFIDSTAIQNFNGSDALLGKSGHKFKGKNQMQLNIISDANKVPIAHYFSSHGGDSTTIRPLIKKMDESIKTHDQVYLIGDKGYLDAKQRVSWRKRKKITTIVERKKNQKIDKRTYARNQILLEKRFIVEHTFCQLKRTYRRLQFITDRKMSHINTFVLMAITCQIMRVIL